MVNPDHRVRRRGAFLKGKTGCLARKHSAVTGIYRHGSEVKRVLSRFSSEICQTKASGLDMLRPVSHAQTEEGDAKCSYKPAGRARFHGPCGQAWISSLISTLAHRDSASDAPRWITHSLRGHPWPLPGELPTESLNHQFFQLRGLTSDAS